MADKRASYITEGTPRHYSFYVPQDVKGLSALMGGAKKLEAALDSLFIKNEYWHGNEPGHQIPFMYNYTAAPWKAQQKVIDILNNEYSDGPGGLGGNDDAGQMSAWYIFAAMGFYPVDPVSNNYILTTPLFEDVTINLPSNKTMAINTHRQSARANYIYKVLWNGKLYSKNYITYSMISGGGQLDIFLQDKATNWGAAENCRPASLTKLP
jgi:predicted alpha-1,2-mannosidase